MAGGAEGSEVIKRVSHGLRVIFYHACDVPFDGPPKFNHQYGAILCPEPMKGQSTAIEFDEASGFWSIDIHEYASPIKHCPLCGVDLLAVEGIPR